MILARFIPVLKDQMWQKLSFFSLILFFILLADALLAYWVPNFLQDKLGSPFLMGIVMGFSSLVGLLADLIFPQTLKNYTVKKLLFSAIVLCVLFVASLFFSVSKPILVAFLISMALWGIYWEFLHFAQQQYIAEIIPLKLRSASWGILGIFKNLAYFLGPIMAGFFLIRGEFNFLIVTLSFYVLGFLFFILNGSLTIKRTHEYVPKISLLRELSRWEILSERVWPIIIISLTLGLIDASFWTVGAVWSEKLAGENFWGSFLLPAYQLPSLFIGLLIAKWDIYKGKKKIAEFFLCLSGITLIFLYFELPVFLYLIIILISSVFSSIVYPLIEAVYTDVIARMGAEKKHLIGLSASTTTLAFVIGPILAGYISDVAGEKMTFVAVGVLTMFVAFFLLLVTPKKLRLPESEIKTWKD